MRVQQPNGEIMQATYTAKLVIDHLPEAVRQAHIFPQLKKNVYWPSEDSATMGMKYI